MADYVPSILGSVMKAIACTPNKNFDEAAYERGVLEPAQRIRRLQEDLNDGRPSDAQLRQVMDDLLLIFATKQVDWSEREDRLREILDLHQLHPLFPDLLPLRQA